MSRGTVGERRAELAATLDAARRAVETARSGTSAEGLAAALLSLGRTELVLYDHPRAQAHLDEALAVLPCEGSPLEQRCQIQLARAENLFKLNDYRLSLEAAHGALAAACADERGNLLGQALAREAAGAASAQSSAYQNAVEHLLQALSAFEAAGQPQLAGRALNYLAVVHEELGDFARAVGYYEQSLAAARKAGNADMEARVLANLGEG